MYYPSDFKEKLKEIEIGNKRNKWFTLESFYVALDEYCKESSLHGLKYLRKPDLPGAERLFWLVIVLFGFYSSAVLTWQLYSSGLQNPIEVSLNPIGTPVWDIPFPAMMICSAYPVKKSVFDLEESYNVTNHLHYSKLICQTKNETDRETFSQQVIDEEFFQFISKAATPCKDLMIKCIWGGKAKDCCHLFKPIITSTGQCYVFNMLPGQLVYSDYTPPYGFTDEFDDRAQFWELDTGYPNRNGAEWKKVYPYWAEHAGEASGMIIDLIDNHSEWQQSCSGGAHGYELKVFSAFQNPETVTGIKLANKVHTHIKVSPFIINSEKNLKSIPLSVRGCVFQDEVILDYFKIYSQSSCLLECYIKNVINHCGCVPFVHQRILGATNFGYCNLLKDSCLDYITEQLNLMQVTSPDLESCQCVPRCSTLNFEYQSSTQPIVTFQTDQQWKKDIQNITNVSYARLSVYFTAQQFTSLSRRISFTFSDFMSNCGGLLGLLLGFSFMSAFEVFYFIIIRPLNRIIVDNIKSR